MKSQTVLLAQPVSSGDGCGNTVAVAIELLPPPSTPAKVVIVEDEEGVRISLKVIVESSGEFVCIGLLSDAETALRSLPDLTPDLVLMDIHLPGMSGIECVRRLRASESGPIFVMVTGLTDEVSMSEASEAGACGYLVKPFSIPQCMATLRFAFKLHSARTSPVIPQDFPNFSELELTIE